MNQFAPLYADQGSTYWEWNDNVIDVSEVTKWRNDEPRWALINLKTEHLHVGNVYTTTANRRVDTVDMVDVQIDDDKITVCQPDSWPNEAKEIMNASGLEGQYANIRAGYTERLFVSGTDEIVLAVGDTDTIEVTATDGKDNSIVVGAGKVKYNILDETIAKVSDGGVVTGLSKGKTVLEIFVIDSNILRRFEKHVYVDDTFESIALEGFEKEVTLVAGATATGLIPYGVTDCGRRLEVSNRTYSIADTTIASVSETGEITPLKEGTTKLTITATAEGKQVSTEFTVIVVKAGEFTASNLWEVFEEENFDSWKGGGTNPLVVTDGVSLIGQLNGYRTFDGVAYKDSLMQFKLKIDTSTGGGSWPSIALRAQGTENYLSKGPDGYLIQFGINGNNLQVDRFNGAQRTVLIGTLGGVEGTYLPSMENPITSGVEHEVKVGAANSANGVRLYLEVDGQLIYDFEDASEDAITNPGYFGIIGRSETFTLTKDTSIPDVAPSPSPSPEVSPSPEASPSPSPEVSPSPSPEASPSPSPEASPSPSPDVSPSPEPSPSPEVSPSPSPETNPSSSPTPEIKPDATDTSYTIGSNGTVKITSTGAFEKFESVEMDGKVVDKSHYTVTKGSTIVTFENSYLETLSVGEHIVTICYNDGNKVNSKLSIFAKISDGENTDGGTNTNGASDSSTNNSSSQVQESAAQTTGASATSTGDNSHLGLWISFALVVILALAAFGWIKLRKQR